MKRILFVNPERKVLETVRAALSVPDSKWDVQSVATGQLALEEMDLRPCDIILTNTNMLDMSGRQLLEHVAARWPQAIRIVFAEPEEIEQAVRLIPVAHQYISKPCPPRQLENIITRCLGLHELLDRPDLRETVGRVRTLPALPKVYAELQTLLTNDAATVKEIAAAIASDASVAARVLQLANSAFFRTARPIANIEQAVTYLGFKAIRNVTLYAEVFSRWPDAGPSVVDLNKLQAHVQAVAVAAVTLTSGTAYADDATLAGLLHDIGYWVLRLESQADLERAVKLAAANGLTLEEAEKQVLGASHAEIGAYLLGIWGLPYSVIEAVAYHHDPLAVGQSGYDALAAVAIAHALVPEDDTSAFAPGLKPDRKIDEHYLQSVRAPFDWQDAAERVTLALEQAHNRR